MLNLFKGKLTYALAASAIVYGLVGLVAGWVDSAQALEIVWIGLAAFGLRRAVQ